MIVNLFNKYVMKSLKNNVQANRLSTLFLYPLGNISIPFEQIVPWAVLLILIAYSYAYFLGLPYLGFDASHSTGEVIAIFDETSAQQNALQLGDKIYQIGATPWVMFASDLQRTLPLGHAGDEITLLIERDEQMIPVTWAMPKLSPLELFKARGLSQWWLPYVFWLAGLFTLLFIRPKNTRWKLMIAFNFLTAVWLSAGMVSQWHFWKSALVLRATICLCLPVYLHFHWNFPRPLSKTPRGMFPAFYVISFILALLAWFQFIPAATFLLIFILALVGSFILLLLHFIFVPAQRHELRFVVSGAMIATGLTVAFALVSFLGMAPPAGAAALLILPILPFSYLYTVYYHQAGGFTLRTNRLISLYLFIIFIVLLIFFLLVFIEQWVRIPQNAVWLSMGVALISSLSIVLVFPFFRRFIDKHVLKIPHSSAHLLESFATQITYKLDRTSLADIMRHNILPTLLIRQSVLIRIEKESRIDIIYKDNVALNQIPDTALIPKLLEKANTYSPPDHSHSSHPTAWIRLILPLQFAEDFIGIWLLGARDPDDVYTVQELPMFRAIANQMAIALSNIVQTENLHQLYRANINREDAERTSLALALHDEVLSEIAVLGMAVDPATVSPQFQEVYTRLTNRLRLAIRDLRPSILEYGLWLALEQMIEHFSEQSNHIPIHLSVPKSHMRYPQQVETHIFRIVHQAVINAQKHSGSDFISIQGVLLTNEVQLGVIDVGCGFSLGAQPNLKTLLTEKHFGLVGMYERADLINGRLEIKSQPNSGTQVVISWREAGSLTQG